MGGGPFRTEKKPAWDTVKPDFHSLNFLERVLLEHFQLFCAHKSDLEKFIEFTPAYKKTVEWKCSFNFVKKQLHNFGRTKFRRTKLPKCFNFRRILSAENFVLLYFRLSLQALST